MDILDPLLLLGLLMHLNTKVKMYLGDVREG